MPIDDALDDMPHRVYPEIVDPYKDTCKEMYFYLNTDNFLITTPKGCSISKRIIDVPFHEFAQNYDIQDALNLLSTVLMKPHVNPPLAYPSVGMELIEGVAGYLCAFSTDKKTEKSRREYLVNNGIVRILITDYDLYLKVREAVNNPDKSIKP
jgi:hypothetical protein